MCWSLLPEGHTAVSCCCRPVEDLLDISSALERVTCFSSPAVICKVTRGALCAVVKVSNKKPLRNGPIEPLVGLHPSPPNASILGVQPVFHPRLLSPCSNHLPGVQPGVCVRRLARVKGNNIHCAALAHKAAYMKGLEFFIPVHSISCLGCALDSLSVFFLI